jgi:hypothetical protein
MDADVKAIRSYFGHSGVMAKIGDFIVEYLHEFEAICKKALLSVLGAKGKLFDEKNQR